MQLPRPFVKKRNLNPRNSSHPGTYLKVTPPLPIPKWLSHVHTTNVPVSSDNVFALGCILFVHSDLTFASSNFLNCVGSVEALALPASPQRALISRQFSKVQCWDSCFTAFVKRKGRDTACTKTEQLQEAGVYQRYLRMARTHKVPLSLRVPVTVSSPLMVHWPLT